MDRAYGRGDNDFDLNYVGWHQLSEEELQAYVEGIAAGAAGEDVGEPKVDEQPLDALYRKGKSKPSNEMGSKICVRNLHEDTTKEKLTELFQGFGRQNPSRTSSSSTCQSMIG